MIDENKLLMELRNVFESKKTYTIECTEEHLRRWIENQPKIEKCGDCSRRKFYQQGYKDGLNENKWTSCSDKMPPNEKEVEITYVRKHWKTGELLYFTARAFYTDGTMVTEDSNFVWYATDNWEWDEERDCYVVPEGWWEYAHFSETFEIVDDKVVAWRLLGEPYRSDYKE